jgi:hypothetical protein
VHIEVEDRCILATEGIDQGNQKNENVYEQNIIPKSNNEKIGTTNQRRTVRVQNEQAKSGGKYGRLDKGVEKRRNLQKVKVK